MSHDNSDTALFVLEDSEKKRVRMAVFSTYSPPEAGIDSSSSAEDTASHLICIMASGSTVRASVIRSTVPDPITLSWDVKPSQISTIQPTAFGPDS
jgi:hypothetical protein